MTNTLAWHNSRPRRWWTIARIKAWCPASAERREATRIRREAMKSVEASK